MSKSIKIGDLGDEIGKVMQEYSNDVSSAMKEEGRLVANEGVKMLKVNSPEKSGKYAASWAKKEQMLTKNESKYVIYNKKHWLTHLLEYPHALRQGGRTNGSPHIKKVEEWCKAEYERRLTRRLSK